MDKLSQKFARAPQSSCLIPSAFSRSSAACPAVRSAEAAQNCGRQHLSGEIIGSIHGALAFVLSGWVSEPVYLAVPSDADGLLRSIAMTMKEGIDLAVGQLKARRRTHTSGGVRKGQGDQWRGTSFLEERQVAIAEIGNDISPHFSFGNISVCPPLTHALARYA
jgi:hypothetical protein